MITREQMRKIAAKHGMKEAPPEDPIYNEPPSVRFINRSKKSTATTGTSSEEQQPQQQTLSEKLDGVEEEMQRRMNIGMNPNSNKK